jgi:phosphatidylglycerol:prolipoprotein diacylglycerol transferase
VAVPSLAAGLGITRIGCYLFGCDYGKPLSDGAPAILKRLGTFPHWAEGTMTDGSTGSPAYDHHVALHLISPDAATSLPVHPTQLYESLLGLSLLTFLMVMRKNQRFRGEIFLWFTFLYGTARFLLELVRDDTERGNIPPSLAPHVLIPVCVGLLGLGYAFGVAPRIASPLLRTVSQIVALVPPVWLFVATRPAEFETVAPIQLSTSQFVGFASGLAACAGFWILNRAALDHPDLAMALPDFSAYTDKPAEDELGDDEEEERRPRPAAPKKAPKKPETELRAAADEALGESTDEPIEPANEALGEPAAVVTERPRTEADRNPRPKKKKRKRTEDPQGGS